MTGRSLSSSCLERMHQVLSEHVERKEVPGLVALVSRRDDIHVETIGQMAFGHPGERWMYHVSIDVLGALVARVAGQSLGSFMRDHIFEPLGMKHTSFQTPSQKSNRLPAFYFFNPQTNGLDLFDDIANSAWQAEPAFESGGGGLVSTIDDYFAFARMLLNKDVTATGRSSHATVELMTSDQLTPEQRSGAELFFGNHSSWSFGMSVNIRRNEIYQNPGRFAWDGGFGTTAYIDPAKQMIGILFTQRMLDSPEAPKVFTTSGLLPARPWNKRSFSPSHDTRAAPTTHASGSL